MVGKRVLLGLSVLLCLLFGTCSLGTVYDTLRAGVPSDNQSDNTSYTVRFVSNGGSSVPSQTVNSGGTATRPTRPTRSGYTFDNWYTTSALTTAYKFSSPVTGDITLYAGWKIITYTVTFESNGGSFIAVLSVNSGSAINRPTDPIRSGYILENWYTDSALKTVYNFSTPVTGDIVLYAKWNSVSANTYTVTFNTNDGSYIATQTVNSGGTATRPTNPIRSGYTFDNWYSNSGLTTVYNFSTPVTGSITLYAKWTPSGPTFDLARAEKVSLGNAWYAVYRFVLPAGKTWADYKGLSADYMFTEEDLAVATARNGRLMGPYETSDFDLYFGQGNAEGKNLAIASYENNKNAEYILDNGRLGNNPTEGALLTRLEGQGIYAEGGKWFTYDKYVIDGSAKYDDYPASRLTALLSSGGPLYFGLGLPGSLQDNTNTYYIRNVKLIGYNASDTVTATPLWFEQAGNLFPAFTGYPSIEGSNGYKDAARLMADGSQPTPVPWNPGSSAPAVINIAAIQGVTVPTTDGIPVTSITENDQYTGTVTWSPNHTTFAASTTYTAMITLTAKSGYTLTGVAADFFTVTGATTVSNSVNSGVITAVFPATAAPIAIEMVYVPGGSFEMGQELGTAGYGDGTPVHTVTLTGFYMGKYPVTQAQYQAVMGSNPSSGYGVGNNYPVYNVSWYDAIEFCNALSIKEGLSPYYTIDKVNKDPNNTEMWDDIKWTITRNSTAIGYRLPTEAQWEYAAKGGNGTPGNYTYSGSNTISDVAWYWNNSNGMTHEVGKKAPNGLGIYDMSGNLWEWCWDWYESYSSEAQSDPVGAASGDCRVLRGGSWFDGASKARSVHRSAYGPYLSSSDVGFRLVRP